MTELAVEARGVSRRFGELLAVDDLDLSIERATIYGFLGPNGSGKTTAIRMLCGLLTPSAGSIEVLGYSMPGDAESLRRHIGYMPQKNALYADMSVQENLRFMASIYSMGRHDGAARIDELLQRYDLKRYRRSQVGSLSGGEKQRVALAAATLHRPELLFLDEPTSEVDPQSRRDFWASLFELIDGGTTVLVTTHFMDEAERCHRLAVLHRGHKMVDGAPQQLMADVPAAVVLVAAGDPRAANRSLNGAAGVLSVAQIGVTLRVLVDRAVVDPLQLVQAQLAAQQLPADCSQGHANLEDVFVVATRLGRGAP